MTNDPLTIPWGPKGQLAPNLPPAWGKPQVAWPDLSGLLDDYPTAVASALDQPLGAGPTLAEAVRGARSVAIVVDDPSRWTPVREAVPILLERLTALGLGHDQIVFAVGVGRHHAVDDAAMRRRLGDAVVGRHRCFSPPVDDRSAYVDLGTTSSGIPTRVFRPVAEADVRILVGSVLPHLQAGFGGGYKLIFPGTSHRSTLGALHRQGIARFHGPDDPTTGSDPLDNPMRRAIGEAARLLGPCLSLSHVIGAPGQVLRVRFGEPHAVQADLSAEARRRFAAPLEPLADIVVAGNHPWPGDPMMSFKVLLQHRAACRPGGVLAGLFWTDEAEIDRSFPMGALRAIAASGSLGGWILRRGLTVADRSSEALGLSSAFMIHWARQLVVDRAVLVHAPPLRARLGPRLGPARLFDDPAELWEAASIALKRQGIDAPRVRVFPQGGLTYA